MSPPLWIPCGWQFDEFGSESVDARGLFGELAQELPNEHTRPTVPVPKADPVADAWRHGEARLHLKLGIGTKASRIDKCDLCADLQRITPTPPVLGAAQHAVPHVRDFYIDPAGESPEWLNRPVLVAAVEAREKHKRVQRSLTGAVKVRLTPTHLCEVCSPDAGELLGKAPVVFDSILEDREGNGVFLLRSELSGGRAPSTDERPRKVVERGPVVVGDIPEQQTPTDRHGFDVLDQDGEAVAFWVVLHPDGAYRIRVTVSCPGLNVSLQRLGVDYCLCPLEPRTLEQRVVGSDGHRRRDATTLPAPRCGSRSANTQAARES